MKKLFIVLLSAGMFAFTACGPASQSEESGEQSQLEEGTSEDTAEADTTGQEADTSAIQ